MSDHTSTRTEADISPITLRSRRIFREHVVILDAPDAFGNRAAAYRLDRFAAVDHRYRKGPASASCSLRGRRRPRNALPVIADKKCNDMAQRMKFAWQTLFFSRP